MANSTGKTGLIDTHCHLDASQFDADRGQVLAAALAAGVDTVLVPSVERKGMDAVARLCAQQCACRPAYGIHPLFVDRAGESDLDALDAFLSTADAVAVGEIGLDHFVAGADHDRQQWFFAAQLRIAARRALPVLLHVRRAQDQVLKQLRRAGVSGGIAHAFNGSLQQAEAFLDLGFKLGFGGAMSFDRALRIRELARRLPLEAIVLETDGPDIPPSWRANRRSEPADVVQTAALLAALRGLSFDEVVAATTENACVAVPRLRDRDSV